MFLLATILSLVLSVYTIFKGGWSGCIIWVIGQVLITHFLFGFQQFTPSFIAVGIITCILQAIAISLQGWKGLCFIICANVGIVYLVHSGVANGLSI